jgi:hypothetical protein
VIFLTLGMHKGSARNEGSSTVDGDLFSFLLRRGQSEMTFQACLQPGNGQPGMHSQQLTMHVCRARDCTYHPSFCVSGAIMICLPSFSVIVSAPLPLTCGPSSRSMAQNSYLRRSRMS